MRIVYRGPQISLFEDTLEDSSKDLIGLKEKGQDLSRLVSEVEDPMVIAIDGAWGSGKSHFLKLWAGSHQKAKDQDTTVIYFDAFENDYLDEPLIGLTKAIIDRLPHTSTARKFVKHTKKMAAKLTMPALRVGGSVLTAGATEITGSIADAAIFSGWREIEKASEQFWLQFTARHSAMHQFRKALDELSSVEGSERRRLVIIIDELDRCRPDYALALLEIAKHFFSSENVHFILGVNTQELLNSVTARYGANINAAKYLQKFISVTMPLANLNANQYEKSAYIRHFDCVARNMGLIGNDGTHYLSHSVRIALESISSNCRVSLRDVEQIASLIAVCPNRSTKNTAYHLVLVGLLILKVVEPKLFDKAVSENLTFHDIEKLFELKPVPLENNDMSNFKITWMAALPGDSGKYRSDKALAAGEALFQDGKHSTAVKRIIAANFNSFKLP